MAARGAPPRRAFDAALPHCHPAGRAAARAERPRADRRARQGIRVGTRNDTTRVTAGGVLSIGPCQWWTRATPLLLLLPCNSFTAPRPMQCACMCCGGRGGRRRPCGSPPAALPATCYYGTSVFTSQRHLDIPVAYLSDRFYLADDVGGALPHCRERYVSHTAVTVCAVLCCAVLLCESHCCHRLCCAALHCTALHCTALRLMSPRGARASWSRRAAVLQRAAALSSSPHAAAPAAGTNPCLWTTARSCSTCVRRCCAGVRCSRRAKPSLPSLSAPLYYPSTGSRRRAAQLQMCRAQRLLVQKFPTQPPFHVSLCASLRS